MSVTPENWSELSEEEREEFAKKQKQKLDSAITETLAEEDEAAQEAFAALEETEETETHTVSLTGGQEVEVLDTMPGELERKAANARDDDIDSGVQSMIDVMTYLIQSDGFDNPAVWEMYYEKYGSSKLLENVLSVTEPYYQRQKKLQNKRNSVGN